MRLRGLNENLYLANNPVIIEVDQLSEDTVYLEIAVQNLTAGQTAAYPVRVFKAGDRVRYNLQELIKANFPAPRHPDSPREDGAIGTNYGRFRITVTEIVNTTTRTVSGTGRSTRGRGAQQTAEKTGTGPGEVMTLTKTFIRGGINSVNTNLFLQPREVLKVSEKIPRWAGFPVARYYLAGGEILYNGIVPETLTEERPVIGCSPLYVRFLNSLGGYSFYLFEQYEERQTNESGLSVSKDFSYTHTGMNTKTEITARTKVNRRYFRLIEDLQQSPEIHLFEMYGKTWAPAVMKTNTFERNNFDNVLPVEISLRVNTTKNPAIVW